MSLHLAACKPKDSLRIPQQSTKEACVQASVLIWSMPISPDGISPNFWPGMAAMAALLKYRILDALPAHAIKRFYKMRAHCNI